MTTSFFNVVAIMYHDFILKIVEGSGEHQNVFDTHTPSLKLLMYIPGFKQQSVLKFTGDASSTYVEPLESCDTLIVYGKAITAKVKINQGDTITIEKVQSRGKCLKFKVTITRPA